VTADVVLPRAEEIRLLARSDPDRRQILHAHVRPVFRHDLSAPIRNGDDVPRSRRTPRAMGRQPRQRRPQTCAEHSHPSDPKHALWLLSTPIPIYSSSVNRMFHVSSVRNRESILAHGLDWTRMSGTRGIAGSRQPEVEGIFLSSDHFTAQFFVRMNNTAGPVDIWAVDDVDPNDLIESGNGFSYVPYRIGHQRLTLHDQELTEDALPPAVEMQSNEAGASTAYSSSLTIALDDGTVLRDDAAFGRDPAPIAAVLRRPTPAGARPGRQRITAPATHADGRRRGRLRRCCRRFRGRRCLSWLQQMRGWTAPPRPGEAYDPDPRAHR